MVMNEKETGIRKSGRKLWACSLLMLLFLVLMSTTALAAKTGWKQVGKKIYYYVAGEDGREKATGLRKIGKRYYYFNKNGVMKTGWVKTSEGFRYFKPTGNVGATQGSMYTGLKTIGKYKYYFDKNGVVTTGLRTVKKKTYFFSTNKNMGVRGRSLKNRWKTVKGVKYYFKSDGTMAKNCWVNKTYYVDKNGQMLKNTVTPDGYLVGSNGKKASKNKVKGWVKINGKYHYYNASKKKLLTSCWKQVNGKYYYLDEDGVRVTGWQNIGKNRYYFNSKGVRQTGLKTLKGKTYYFDAKGRLQRNTTIDGYTIDANGVATKIPGTDSGKKKILIIAGHGQGDPGATSSWGYESNYTRQFAKLIYNELKSSGKVDVTFYKNGSSNYDCYQQNAKTLGSGGLNLSSKITGKGTNRSKVLSGIKTNPNIRCLRIMTTYWKFILTPRVPARIPRATAATPESAFISTAIRANIRWRTGSCPRSCPWALSAGEAACLLPAPCSTPGSARNLA